MIVPPDPGVARNRGDSNKADLVPARVLPCPMRPPERGRCPGGGPPQDRRARGRNGLDWAGHRRGWRPCARARPPGHPGRASDPPPSTLPGFVRAPRPSPPASCSGQYLAHGLRVVDDHLPATAREWLQTRSRDTAREWCQPSGGPAVYPHDCAGAATDVLDHFRIGEPVDWVGNAMGGHVGIPFAATYPGRCRSLATIGSLVHALTPPERRKIALLTGVYRLTGALPPLVNLLTDALLGP